MRIVCIGFIGIAARKRFGTRQAVDMLAGVDFFRFVASDFVTIVLQIVHRWGEGAEVIVSLLLSWLPSSNSLRLKHRPVRVRVMAPAAVAVRFRPWRRARRTSPLPLRSSGLVRLSC